MHWYHISWRGGWIEDFHAKDLKDLLDEVHMISRELKRQGFKNATVSYQIIPTSNRY
jgi:hypothetical protein